MPRINAASFHFTIEAGNTPRLSLAHATGHALTYTGAQLAAVLSAPQLAGLRAALLAIHVDAEAKIRALLDAKRADMNVDP